MRFLAALAFLAIPGTGVQVAAGQSAAIDFRVLATTKTSSMERELNEAAEAGFRFQAVMGGDTALGGSETRRDHAAGRRSLIQQFRTIIAAAPSVRTRDCGVLHRTPGRG